METKKEIAEKIKEYEKQIRETKSYYRKSDLYKAIKNLKRKQVYGSNNGL